VLPILVEQTTLADQEEFQRTFRMGLKLLFLLTLPATVFLIVLGVPLVRVIYERRQFTPYDTEKVAWALAFHSLGLLGMGAMSMISRVFYAFQETLTPVAVSFVRAAVNIGLNFALAFTFFQHGGIALASSVSFTAGAFLLYELLRRRLHKVGIRLTLGNARRPLLGYVAAAATMGVVMVGEGLILARIMPGIGIVRDMSRMALLTATGLPVFALLCAWFDPGILRNLREWSRRRPRRAAV
jgi:putative peptidoglycan lipid II flippase